MIDQDFTNSLLAKHDYLSKISHADCLTLSCLPADWVDFAKFLNQEEAFELLVDLTAIDQGDTADIRFEVVAHFYSRIHHDYLRVHIDCLDNESPEVDSIASIYPAADWHEREAFDMFGIIFTGHPNLKRILMWDEYPYHPLRKEFPLAGIDTPLPAADVVEATGASVEPAPMMGGPFVSPGSGPMSDAEPRAKDESWTEQIEKPV
ncbi:MAG: NADH-quinone oxidoreductase subunit C [Opitutales bacterium]|nr:NADH-quinone oxidoreductase subunit C [Opitutales bacterium]